MDDAFTSQNTNEDYDKLLDVIFNEAIGDSEAQVETSTLTRETEDGTIHQTRRKKRPNVSLAMKLLESRIGGPQDWC